MWVPGGRWEWGWEGGAGGCKMGKEVAVPAWHLFLREANRQMGMPSSLLIWEGDLQDLTYTKPALPIPSFPTHLPTYLPATFTASAGNIPSLLPCCFLPQCYHLRFLPTMCASLPVPPPICLLHAPCLVLLPATPAHICVDSSCSVLCPGWHAAVLGWVGWLWLLFTTAAREQGEQRGSLLLVDGWLCWHGATSPSYYMACSSYCHHYFTHHSPYHHHRWQQNRYSQHYFTIPLYYVLPPAYILLPTYIPRLPLFSTLSLGSGYREKASSTALCLFSLLLRMSLLYPPFVLLPGIFLLA